MRTVDHGKSKILQSYVCTENHDNSPQMCWEIKLKTRRQPHGDHKRKVRESPESFESIIIISAAARILTLWQLVAVCNKIAKVGKLK